MQLQKFINFYYEKNPTIQSTWNLRRDIDSISNNHLNYIPVFQSYKNRTIIFLDSANQVKSDFSSGRQCDAFEFLENILANVDLSIQKLFEF